MAPFPGQTEPTGKDTTPGCPGLQPFDCVRLQHSAQAGVTPRSWSFTCTP